MRICVIGTGYVGLVTGACLADFGHNVTCVDKDLRRIFNLERCRIPFYEPELPELVSRNVKARRLFFSENLLDSVRNAQVIFITVGTPAKPNGEADISAVIDVASQIAKAMKSTKCHSGDANLRFKTIVNKSTVPVGMGDVVTRTLKENGVPEKSFSVVSNPEFLREGSAVRDFFNPDRIIVGASSNKAFNIITELYRPLNAHIIFTDIKSAELIKYAANAFLATKISFINELANICEKTGVDVVQIADAIGLDKRIGREFLNAGLGYGGSCFPKDVLALISLARSVKYEPLILSAVNKINEFQVIAFLEKIERKIGNLEGQRVAILGLAFKPGTDDLREAPALKLIAKLLESGVRIKAYDPVVRGKAGRDLRQIELCPNVYETVKGADAVIFSTEWPEFKEIDFVRIGRLMRKKNIFDGRNIYNPKKLKELGFRYYGVGR